MMTGPVELPFGGSSTGIPVPPDKDLHDNQEQVAENLLRFFFNHENEVAVGTNLYQYLDYYEYKLLYLSDGDLGRVSARIRCPNGREVEVTARRQL